VTDGLCFLSTGHLSQRDAIDADLQHSSSWETKSSWARQQTSPAVYWTRKSIRLRKDAAIGTRHQPSESSPHILSPLYFLYTPIYKQVFQTVASRIPCARTHLYSFNRAYINYMQLTNNINTPNFVFNNNVHFICFQQYTIRHFTTIGSAWDNHFNNNWFYLRNLANCLYFISILVNHPDDGRKCDRNM
jgi:hypothetical protein